VAHSRGGLCQRGELVLEDSDLFETAFAPVVVVCSGGFLSRRQRVVAPATVGRTATLSQEGFPGFEIAVLEAVEHPRIELVVVDQTAKALALWIGDESLGGQSPEDWCAVEF